MSERPFADIESTLRAIRGSMEEAATRPKGSDEALKMFEQCLWCIGEHFSEHIKVAFPRRVSDRQFHADAEKALDLFIMVSGFPGEMAGELRMAMAGLRIGDVRKSVTPVRTRQGGVSDLDALHAKAVLVGAADRLKAISGNSEAYKEELNARGLNARTIERYRREIKRTDVTGKTPVKWFTDESMNRLIEWAMEKLKARKIRKIKCLPKVSGKLRG